MTSAIHPLLRIALLACPAEFRSHYAADLAHDLDRTRAQPLPLVPTCLNVAWTGVRLHAENVWRDLAFALRLVRKNPLFAAMVVLAIAVAVASNTAAAGVLHGVLLRPLPFQQPDRLVFAGLSRTSPYNLSYLDAADVQRAAHSFSMFALEGYSSKTMSGRGPSQELSGRIVSASYFRVLGVRPELGRFFDSRDGARRIVISDALWRERFGASPAVLGKSITLDALDYTIVGVAPPQLRDPAPTGITPHAYWLPIDPAESSNRQRGWFQYAGIARLRDGVSVARAQADLDRVASVLVRTYPANHVGVSGASVTPMLSRIVGPVQTMLWLLYGCAVVVLLVACANIANLQLVRAAVRERELGIRASLGATRARIIRQLFTETMLLATVGGVAGVALAWAALEAFSSAGSTFLPRWEDVRIDGTVLAYSVALVVAIAIATGVLPGLLQRGGGPRRRAAKTLRSGLVAAEVGLACALLVYAFLLARSFFTLTHVPLGFDTQNLYGVTIYGTALPKYRQAAGILELARRAGAGIERIPGVRAQSGVWSLPFEGFPSTGVTIAGTNVTHDSELQAIAPQYFRALGAPIVEGRAFAPSDRASSLPVVIVSVKFARAFFGTTHVLGKRVTPGFCINCSTPPPRTIVGVAADVRDSFVSPYTPMLYLPLTQAPALNAFLVRTSGRNAGLAGAVARVFARVDPQLPRPEVQSFDEVIADNTAQARGSALLFLVLGAIALILSVAGIYAVTAYSVAQRTHEFGIARAVGARSAHVLRDVLARALMQSGAGVLAGIVLAAACAPLIAGLLFQTSPLDGPTFFVVAAVLVAASLLAAGVPAVRAVRVNPAEALRYE
jgi:putative ABC transport system permease protein